MTFLPAWALSNPSWAGGGIISQPATGQLCEGVEGAAVEALQRRLDLLGYQLVPDGDFGPKTTAAVRDFQLRHHLVVDGIVGPATQAALAAALLAFPPAGPFAGYPVLRAGDHGSKVVTFQRALNALRADPALVADGDFGALTTARTRDLQALAGLVVDGVAGPVTLAAVGFYLALNHVTL